MAPIHQASHYYNAVKPPPRVKYLFSYVNLFIAIAGSGKCKSGRFLVLDNPLLSFSSSAAACAKAGKKLATIDAVFGGSGRAL